MNHKDHDMQLAPDKSDPLIQLLWTKLPLTWNGAPRKLCIVCPLYKVIINAPIKDNRVPKTLATPRGFLTSTTSNLFTRIMKPRMKIDTTILLIFENINFFHSPECNCKYKSKGWDCVSHGCIKGRSGIFQACEKHVQGKTGPVFHN